MKSLALAISCLCVSVSVHAVGVSGQGTWESTLQGRDLDGDLTTAEAYYDTVLGITWLADANATVGSVYDTWNAGSGSLNWADANSWVEELEVAGITGWRLPNTLEPDPSCDPRSGNDHFVNCTGSEMGNLFYYAMGNTVGSSSNTGPFSNVQYGWYWSATPYAQGSGEAWIFNMYSGDQNYFGEDGKIYAWAVHDGSVGVALPTSAVPLPASVWLLGSGLLGLIGLSRKNSAQ